MCPLIVFLLPGLQMNHGCLCIHSAPMPDRVGTAGIFVLTCSWPTLCQPSWILGMMLKPRWPEDVEKIGQ
jgi:hypothetical protein